MLSFNVTRPLCVPHPRQRLTIRPVDTTSIVVAGDRVIDATSIVDDHPGGVEALLSRSGGAVDATKDENFHLKPGKKMWVEMQVGVLVGPQRPPKKAPKKALLPILMVEQDSN